MGRDRPTLNITIDAGHYNWLEGQMGPGDRFRGKYHGVERGLWVLKRIDELELAPDEAPEICEDFQNGDLARIQEPLNKSSES